MAYINAQNNLTSTTSSENDSNEDIVQMLLDDEGSKYISTKSEEEVRTTTEASSRVPEFTCEKVGRFSYPDSCGKYYYCWSTVHRYAIFTCPKVFDPVSKRCVENYALCPLAPKCETDKQILPVFDDKTTFFECSLLDGNATSSVYELHKFDCEEGREFDADLGYCSLTSFTDQSSSENESSEWFECNRVGSFIDYSSDIHYIKCAVKNVSKGELIAIRRNCPKYKVFSAVDKKCIRL